MNFISLLTAAISPGIALLCYIYLKDRYHAEPVPVVVKMFLFGVLIVIPVMVLQSMFVPGVGPSSLAYSFILSAGLEEFFKWFILYYLIFKHAEFDEPYDGIVYATAVSLGFATMENIFYVLLHDADFSFLMIRAFLPVSGHAIFGVVMGFYLGKAKFSPNRQTFYLLLSVLCPVLYHGLFDYILANAKAWLAGIVLLMAYLWALALWKMRHANARSPYRAVQPDDQIKI